MKINWSRDGRTAFTPNGCRIRRMTRPMSSGRALTAYYVFNADDVLVGRFKTRAEAVEAVTR